MQGKVEICGVNTSRLKTLKSEEMSQLLRQAREVCASSSPARFPKPLAWAALGAGTTGLAWLLTLLL